MSNMVGIDGYNSHLIVFNRIEGLWDQNVWEAGLYSISQSHRVIQPQLSEAGTCPLTCYVLVSFHPCLTFPYWF